MDDNLHDPSDATGISQHEPGNSPAPLENEAAPPSPGPMSLQALIDQRHLDRWVRRTD